MGVAWFIKLNLNCPPYSSRERFSWRIPILCSIRNVGNSQHHRLFMDSRHYDSLPYGERLALFSVNLWCLFSHNKSLPRTLLSVKRQQYNNSKMYNSVAYNIFFQMCRHTYTQRITLMNFRLEKAHYTHERCYMIMFNKILFISEINWRKRCNVWDIFMKINNLFNKMCYAHDACDSALRSPPTYWYLFYRGIYHFIV